MILIKEMILNETFYLIILIYFQYLVYLSFMEIDELSDNNNQLRSKF